MVSHVHTYICLDGDTMPILLETLKIRHSFVRKAVVQAMLRLSQTMPGQAGDAMPSLIEALKEVYIVDHKDAA